MWYNLTDEKRKQIFDQAPQYWLRKLSRHKGRWFKPTPRNISIVHDRLLLGNTYESIGIKHKISKERVRQISWKALGVIARRYSNKSGRKEFEKNMTINAQGNKKGIPVKEEEFEQVKELTFRGESQQAIAKIVKRGVSTIAIIQASDSLADYYDKTRSHVQSSGAKPSMAIPSLIQRDPYPRLKQIREQLDEVLIDVVTAEIGMMQGELKKENDRLKFENAKLKKRIEELETPSFTNKLKEKLDTIQSETTPALS